MRNEIKVGTILALAGSLGIAPYLYHAGLVQWLDWHLHLFWLQEFHHSLGEGNIYPRWLANANGGYGSPVFVYYSPLAYFLGSLGIALFGSVLGGLKFVFCLAILLSVYTSYVFIRRDSKPVVAAVFAALIGLSPQWLFFSYRFNMPATTLALVFVPLVLLGLNKLDQPGYRWRLLVAISFALVIVSHTLTGFMLGMIAGLWCLWFGLLRRRWGQMWAGLTSLALGVGLSGVYLLPALVELPLVHAENLQAPLWLWFKNFLFLAERSPDAAFNFDAPLLNAINAATAGALLIAQVVYWKHGARKSTTALYFGSAWFCLFLMLPLSWPIYEWIAVLQKIQFPWRWQPFFSLFALAAMATTWSNARLVGRSLRVLQVLALIPGLYFSSQLTTTTKSSLDAAYRWTSAQDVIWALQASRWDTLEHRPWTMGAAWERDLHGNSDREAFFVQGGGVATRVVAKQQEQAWDLVVTRAGKLRLKILYFPGWRAYLDGKPVDLSYSAELGAIIVPVPEGRHRLTLVFESTYWRQMGLWLSGVTLALLILLGAFKRGR